jgi:hypothetical protein
MMYAWTYLFVLVLCECVAQVWTFENSKTTGLDVVIESSTCVFLLLLPLRTPTSNEFSRFTRHIYYMPRCVESFFAMLGGIDSVFAFAFWRPRAALNHPRPEQREKRSPPLLPPNRRRSRSPAACPTSIAFPLTRLSTAIATHYQLPSHLYRMPPHTRVSLGVSGRGKDAEESQSGLDTALPA